MSNAVLTNPSALPPPLDISSSPHLLLHLWLPSLSSPSLTTPPSAPQLTPPFPLLSPPLSLYACFLHPPFIIRSPHISASPHSFSFCSHASPFLSSICPLSPCLPLSFLLSAIHPQCFAVSHPLWRHHMCDAGQCVCVCVEQCVYSS